MDLCTILFTSRLKERRRSSRRGHRAAGSVPGKPAAALGQPRARVLAAMAAPPAAASASRGPELRAAHGHRVQEDVSPRPGRDRLCICRAVSVTRSEERFGLTNLFQNTCLLLLLLSFAFVCVTVVAGSTLQGAYLKPHIHRYVCENPRTRTSVFTCAAHVTK